MSDFINISKFPILFYCIFDTITTILCLKSGRGYESNVILSYLFNIFGLYSLVIFKIIAIFCFYIAYKTLGNNYKYTVISSTVIGIYLTIRNSLVYLGV